MATSPKTKTTNKPKKVTYTFPEVMGDIQFKRWTREAWNNEQIFIFIMDDKISITLPENEYIPCPLIVSKGDLFAKDWYHL